MKKIAALEQTKTIEALREKQKVLAVKSDKSEDSQCS